MPLIVCVWMAIAWPLCVSAVRPCAGIIACSPAAPVAWLTLKVSVPSAP